MSKPVSKFDSRRVGSFLSSVKGYYNRLFSSDGIILGNRDATLQRGYGHGNETGLYLDLFSEAYIQDCFNRLLEVATSGEVVFLPGGEDDIDIECHEFIQKNFIENGQLLQTIETLFIAVITGIMGIEKNFGTTKNGKLIYKSLTPIDSDRILYEYTKEGAEQIRITTRHDPLYGELIDPDKLVIHRYYSIRLDTPYGLGLGSQLARVCQHKDEVMKRWLRLVDKYSSPIIIGEIGETIDDAELDSFFNDLRAMSENATYILPEGMNIRVEDISATGADSLIQPIMTYLDQRIAGLILGEHLTGEALANGNQARDNIASEITKRKAASIMIDIDDTINNNIIYQLASLNFPLAKPPILSHSYEDAEDLTEFASVLAVLNQLGYKVDPAFIEEKTGFPQAPEDESRRPLGNLSF